MYKLKLVKGHSYTGYGVKATQKSPFVEVSSKEISDSLIASGYFSLAAETETPTASTIASAATAETEAETETDIEKISLAQLKALAQQIGLDTKGLKSKADYIEAINTAEELFPDEA
ncbi:MAG: hypothetical protein LUF89_01505 [Ruminococcus sp.]|nr:hypothetical protein [Ruminococcus sp.]